MKVATLFLALTALSVSSAALVIQTVPFETLLRDISFTVGQIRANSGDAASAVYQDAIAQLGASLNRPLWSQVITEVSELMTQVDAAFYEPVFNEIPELIASFASGTVGSDLGERLITRVRRALDAIRTAIANYPEWNQDQASSIFNDENLAGLLAPWEGSLEAVGDNLLDFAQLFAMEPFFPYAGMAGLLFAADINPGAEAMLPGLTALYNKVKEFNDAIRLLISNGRVLYQAYFDALGSEAVPYVELAWTQLREFVEALFGFLPVPLSNPEFSQIVSSAVQIFWGFLIEWAPKVLAAPGIWGSLYTTIDDIEFANPVSDSISNVEDFTAYYAGVNQAIVAGIQASIDSQ